jgi:hypothetical protein
MTDGTRTTAEAVLTTGWPVDLLTATGTGSSGRERGDKFDETVGDDLAIARALRSLAARLERRARGKVNHAESIKVHKAEIAARKAAEYEPPQTDGEPKFPTIFTQYAESIREAAESVKRAADQPVTFGDIL